MYKLLHTFRIVFSLFLYTKAGSCVTLFRKGGGHVIRWLKAHFHSDMIRPLVYKIFTRGILALFAAQLVHFFVPAGYPIASFSNLSLLLGLLFALFAFLAWLRLDGVKIPQLKLPRMKRKDPPFLTGDMADHLDDDLVSFDDLDPEDQNVCVLLADLILMPVCLLLAAIV